MKRALLVLLCLGISVAPAGVAARGKSDGLFSILQNGKIGFIDRTGKLIITPRFESVDDFSEGLARITITTDPHSYPFTKYGYIDTTGEIVIKPQFDEAYDFSEGLALVKVGDLHGFIDRTGQMVIEPQFYGARGMDSRRD